MFDQNKRLFYGKRVVGKGSWKKRKSWKVLSWKVWSWKVSVKLERTERSWKEPSEVGKSLAKLERA